ncbi:MAG: small subunit ribosomal protein S1 [Microgenomates group bacterium Gr01-1014_7]|nr:MAG: small subunit ribosomal protein S1 [Microgenomates group bacterium Gr01-1014_7]
MASQTQKITKLSRGQQIEGEIVAITDRELTLDLGAKSEGTLSARELPESLLKDLKPGDKVKAYVVIPENEYGQIILSYQQKRDDRASSSRGYPQSRGINWPKFTQAQNQKNKLQGIIKEANKGGLIVEVDGSRGFIPHSQLGLELLGKDMDELIGQQISVSVIEVDEGSNKLVFSQKEAESEAFDKAVEKYKPDEMVKGEVVNVSEAGVTVKLEDGIEGFLRASKADTKYETGKSMSFLVDSIDTQRKRINLAPFVTSTTGLIYK